MKNNKRADLKMRMYVFFSWNYFRNYEKIITFALQ